ncbi:thiamine diphosphokinase [Phyllobacterium sp. 21LDTY02-6]|jgi:thiamine pyrophosphokinase|uniref:thiamine diphosphokinase n=1 Tax=unclassified Phyllobacterium TaxID=2638441 RepID=UPI00201FC170|nr:MULTISPECIES: thiamine diphosphokinase [unclassified Phyllobacterium]MCO4317552.1 thiamine diphosphokinase [Phyllobacterium sp. 21LDTY02-6]MCX8293071.1 thiamine diphosphokinase [Phyllobacterium sp. 0TCS1.6A]
MSKFVVLLGGSLVVTPRLLRLVEGARVLAADGGAAHAEPLGLVPELWLGDFDSTSPELERQYAEVPRQTFPARKDMTDGELAVEEAFRRGATHVILCGAFGGERTDHMLLHLTMAVRFAAEGRLLTLCSGTEEAHPVVAGDYDFDFEDGTPFSIVAFSELHGLFISGASWPLENMELSFGSSLTVSNAVCGRLHVSLHSGKAILIAAPPIASRL